MQKYALEEEKFPILQNDKQVYLRFLAIDKIYLNINWDWTQPQDL